MRFANNFSPEWGYLAPAPSFARTARIVLVAAAIGASAGGAVVFSLVGRPAAEETSVAARTLAQPADSASGARRSSAPPDTVTQSSPQPQIHRDAQSAVASQDATLASAHAATSAAAEAGASSADQGPAGIAGLAESPAVTDVAPAAALREVATEPEAAPAQKKGGKKQRVTSRNAPHTEPTFGGSRGPLALLRSFSASFYQSRGDY